MLSIELLRINQNLHVAELVRRAGISKQTYYNLLSGLKPASQNTLDRLAQVLECPYLPSLHLLDRLYTNGVKIDGIKFPEFIPDDLRKQLLREHPVFLNESKYNRLKHTRQ